MMKDNVDGALRLLTNNQCKGIFPLHDVTMNELHIKHLEACPMYDDLLIREPIVLANEVILNGIDESEILRVCVRTKGAGGVSGLGAKEWQK